jgi:(E)-4-hydroxy-3-methylbut-2-enyl-diphosphate synthase
MRSKEITTTVAVGDITIGGCGPVIVQAMTDTDTANPNATAAQCAELAEAGAEIVRITVNTDNAAAAVPEIRSRLDDLGISTPLVGDFHFNGHLLLRDHLRIGVNAGSLDPAFVATKMQENAVRSVPLSSDEVIHECMVTSALHSTEAALHGGLAENRIVLSAKLSSPRQLIAVYRDLARQTRQPLHLGLTEAGMGIRGLVWSSSAIAVLLAEGIGDTIRVSLTPEPGGSRTDEVRAACEILQSLGLRSFAPTIVACPGCGRTESSSFKILARTVENHVRECLPYWRLAHPGVEDLKLAVMGCIVNGPGESRAADIGISLPGTGEEPRCPVYVDGKLSTTLQGTHEEIAQDFVAIIDEYVRTMKH